VLSGAQLMCPGLTSPGGKLPEDGQDIEKGQVVAINAEGKENAVMVGILKMGTKEIKTVKKGVAVEGGMYLGDGLWNLKIQ
jgi:malignant T-cell-amplified sequence